MENVIKQVNNTYVSCGCNRTPHAADWGHNGLICYGACNAVAIYDNKAGHGGKVLATLTGHQGRVNAVKWVRRDANSPEFELVSVSTDQCGLVWTKTDDTFIVSSVLKGHEGPVTVVDAVYCQRSSNVHDLLVVTASADSTIRIWERRHLCEAVECRHVLPLDSGLCLSACLAVLPGGLVILAAGLDDANIHLYSESVSDSELSKQRVLRGHEDWVSALKFTREDGGDLLLASGGQDATVRLWRFHPVTSDEQTEEQLITVEQQVISVGGNQLTVGLESVLLGHDGRVYGLCWHPPVLSGSGKKMTQPLQLLTASLDKTVVVWAPDTGGGGVWLEQARMGEMGGNTLGFYGACYGPAGASILAHSYTGGFHIWNKDKDVWRPGVVVGGHYDAISDLAWEPQLGRFVMTVSSDQTTRLHAPWVPTPDRPSQDYSWHEIARPQIHGYDLVCLAMLPHFRFVSGADEKVVRAFTATQNFLENFSRICSPSSVGGDEIGEVSLPTGAAVPVLGLSNKAVFHTEVDQAAEKRHVKDQYDENSYFTPQHLTEPPTEDTLLQNTLWPETMKLYGHGYEIFSLAATTDGKLIASACKATNEEHAAILLWDTTSWQKVGRLVSHQLTVTQLQFSPDDSFLLSVSRDRRWSVFQKSESESERYKLIGRSDKNTGVHARIIWCCAWSHNSAYFATGSRDGKVVLWGKQGENYHPTLGPFAPSSDHLDLPKESITSVAFAPGWVLSPLEYLLAVGTDAGDIRLYGWRANAPLPWRFLYQLSGPFGHQLGVKRLAFRPVVSHNENQSSRLHLASCGLDHTLKIFDVHVQCK